MTIPFLVPMLGDMPDALDVINPNSAVNRLWRMFNERRLVAAYPNNTDRLNNAVLVNFPVLRYRGGTQSIDNIPTNFDVVPVSNPALATIDHGSDVQTIRFWNGILEGIYGMAKYFARTSFVEAGIAGTLSSIPVKTYRASTQSATAQLLFEDARINGIERRTGEDVETVTGYGTLYQSGDIIGSWVFRDVARLLSLLKYLYFKPINVRETFNDGGGFEASYQAEFNDYVNSIILDWNRNLPPSTRYSFESDGIILLGEAQLRGSYSTYSKSWWYDGGLTTKIVGNPGYIAPRATHPLSRLDVYAECSATDGLQFYPQFVGAEQGTYVLVKSSVDPLKASPTIDFVDIGIYFDQGAIPIRDQIPLVDGVESQNRWYGVGKPFFIGTGSYEFEGVTG